ncbi:hypothetical protein QN277_026492 [Acacia crassicarpa]|uniref:CONSTANS-like protein n=1 Tax=Acacia crassicarpa TaxID=499986 RepID=A0AAE1J7R2_9FABA|nr:hypothetical protein QN277_026492 [Acacia crassicarpa]
MGIERGGLKGLRGGWSVAAKPCDSCKSAASAVFCHADSAFLCVPCDTRIHCGQKLGSRHERVWMCEVCEQAPASVTCKADAAALCVTCDSDIHSANPLASRHERVPVEAFYDSADLVTKSSASVAAFNFFVPNNNGICSDGYQTDDPEPVPWLVPNHQNFNSKVVGVPQVKSGDMFFSEMDPFMDFDYSNSYQNNSNHGPANDSVVPVQNKPVTAPMINHSESCFDIDFCRSKLSSFSCYPSQSVSSPSLDVGVVPDSVSEMSFSLGRNMSNSSETAGIGSAGNNQATQLGGMDREARVLRYREKRKNRKFEKTIRYASRKAYAETRPRIKGRFAKRSETESEVDRVYSPVSTGGLMMDTQYGVVPSF